MEEKLFDNAPYYLGVKMIQAEPMTRGEYHLYRGWTIPEDENPADEGFVVRYRDGYISWSPLEQFKEAYRQTTGMNFGLALEAMKRGSKVQRAGWNGDEKYGGVFMKLGGKQLRKVMANGMFTDWFPVDADLFADDWSIV